MKSLITGISGQTGAYLAAILQNKGHEIHGVSRDECPNQHRLTHLGVNNVTFHQCKNSTEISQITTMEFDHIYHLAAESSVATSFENPLNTVEANMAQSTAWFQGVRDHSPHTKIFNAASSEIFKPTSVAIHENASTYATNPYAVTKLAAFQMAEVFKSAYGLYISSGFLFNHESPLRGRQFVTTKIIEGLVRVAANPNAPAIELGNIYAERDFSHAEDIAKGIAAVLMQPHPENFIFGSGKLLTIKDFFVKAATYLGLEPNWEGRGVDEICRDASGRVIACINTKFYRPVDEQGKFADFSKAKEQLDWFPMLDLDDIVKSMVDDHIN